jgi:dolichyl-phosphate beta-glucosyltransferase
MKNTDLSIIIPAFNEEKRLRDSLAEILEKAGAVFPSIELIVVDDGSTDETSAIAEVFIKSGSNPGRVIRIPENRGKGYAVKKGLLAASGSLALMTDADLSTPIEELERLVQLLEQRNADMVIGSRGLSASDVRVHQPWYREYGGKAFNFFVRAVTFLPYRDTQCGFKLFNLSSCRGIFEQLRVNRFAFDVEILFLAEKAGLKVVEEPVIWRHSEGSKVNMLPDSILTFLELLQLRWDYFRGRYRI